MALWVCGGLLFYENNTFNTLKNEPINWNNVPDIGFHPFHFIDFTYQLSMTYLLI
ncbi:hypothetical protein HMPREF0793_0867 [Staphylococcus caprae M23864:W1]|nr:hypothetical protein HMPREF0793_0867 [Staphylococcus caprae M23864:W1]